MCVHSYSLVGKRRNAAVMMHPVHLLMLYWIVSFLFGKICIILNYFIGRCFGWNVDALGMWWGHKYIANSIKFLFQLKKDTSGDEVPFLVQSEACFDTWIAIVWTEVTPASRKGRFQIIKLVFAPSVKNYIQICLRRLGKVGAYYLVKTFLFMYLGHMAQILNILSRNAFFYIY